jgi:tyrosyl-tRNA synthetase
MSVDFLSEFTARGFLHQATDLEALQKIFKTEKISGYIGFDATASSLHVGNLMQLMIFRLMQKHGHKPIVLVGGGTTKIGDPSGRDETRKLLDEQGIEDNLNGIKKSISKFVKFGTEKHDAIMVNNADWLDKINYIEFLRDYGKHFSINRMLSFDSVALRLEREQSLSFLEFNYMILQAYDFVELHKRHDCRLQFGGSDQWGNIVNGIELNRRLGQKEIFGITTPLITTASGAKMGKSVSGAVWLNEEMLSPYDYYQFWRNTEDLDVIKFMKLYTDLELDEIEKLAKLEGQEINEAKKILAFEATKLCHGEENAKLAEETAVNLFEKGTLDEHLPTLELTRNEIAEISIPEIYSKLELATSNGEAKRLIKAGGARMNDNIIEETKHKLDLSDFVNNKIKISSGKKKHAIIRLID